MLQLNPHCIDCFRALAVEARFTIFNFIKTSPHRTTINSIVKMVGLTQPTVTFHVNKLVKANLVVKQKVGRNQYCTINERCKTCPLFV